MQNNQLVQTTKRRLTGNLRDSIDSSKKTYVALEHMKGCIFNIIKPGTMGYKKPWRLDCPGCAQMAGKEIEVDENDE